MFFVKVIGISLLLLCAGGLTPVLYGGGAATQPLTQTMSWISSSHLAFAATVRSSSDRSFRKHIRQWKQAKGKAKLSILRKWGKLGTSALPLLPVIENVFAQKDERLQRAAVQTLQELAKALPQATGGLCRGLLSTPIRRIPYLISQNHPFWSKQPSGSAVACFKQFIDQLPYPKKLKLETSLRLMSVLNILQHIGPSAASAIPSVAKILKGQDLHNKLLAIVVLGQIGAKSTQAIPFLIGCFQDPNTYVQRKAVWRLSAFGKRALPFLLRALKSKKKRVFVAATQTLTELYFRKNISLVDMQKGILQQLQSLLKSKDAEVRLRAAGQLAKWGRANPSILMLAKFLHHSNLKYSSLASLYLGQARKYALPALPAMIKKLASSDGFVLIELANTIGSLGPKASLAIPTLLTRFRADKNINSRHRWTLAKALGDIGTKSIKALPEICEVAFCLSLTNNYFTLKHYRRAVRQISGGKTCALLYPKRAKIAKARCSCESLHNHCRRWLPKANRCLKLCKKEQVCVKNKCISKKKFKKPAWVTTTQPRMFSPYWIPLDVHFGVGKKVSIKLIGLFLDKPSGYKRGGKVKLKFLFKCVGHMTVNWRVFIHADPVKWTRNRLNWDHRVAKGKHPTTLWQPGDYIIDEINREIPKGFPSHYNGLNVYMGFWVGSQRLKVLHYGSSYYDGNSRVKVFRIKLLP